MISVPGMWCGPNSNGGVDGCESGQGQPDPVLGCPGSSLSTSGSSLTCTPQLPVPPPDAFTKATLHSDSGLRYGVPKQWNY